MRLVNLSNLQPFQAVNLLSDPGSIAGPKVIPNCCQVRLNWSQPNGKQAHMFAYANWSGSPPLSTTVATNLFNQIFTGAAWSTLQPFLATTGSIQSLTLLDIRTTTGIEFTSTGAAQPGTSTGTAYPEETAICITLKTANRGQSGRGRMYLPILATTAGGAGGLIAAACVTAVTNWAANNLKPQIDSQLGQMSLALPARAAYTSPVTGRQFPARNAQTVPIIQVLCRDNHWDSQRKRGLR